MVVGWSLHLSPTSASAPCSTAAGGHAERPAAGNLAQFIAVVIGSTLFHGVIVLPLILWLVAGCRRCVSGEGARD